MTRTLAQIKRYRSRFGWVFLISAVILLVSSMVWLFGALPAAEPAPPTDPQDFDHAPPPPPTTGLAVVLSVASLLTSATSLVGFVVTTVLAWRKERREQRHADIEIEKKKLEIERLRLELGRSEVQAPPMGDNSDDSAQK